MSRSIGVIGAILCALATASGASAQGNILEQARQAAGAVAPAAKPSGSLPGVTQTQAGGALKEALKKGVDSVVGRLGKPGGFLTDPVAKILLPGALKDAMPILKAAGQAGLLTDLEKRMNSGAEAATPLARNLFRSAIDKMTIQDAIGIVTGGETAGTEYLRRTAGQELALQMRPIVSKQLEQAGAVKAFDKVSKSLGGAKAIGAVAGVLGGALGGKSGGQSGGQSGQASDLANFKMTDYVTDKAVDGIFHYVGKEEAAIRANPLGAGSSLIKTVFGAIGK
jgi:hypothetical protein